MVNWCPRCLTAISDIEVEHRQKKVNLWDIKYPLIDEKTQKPGMEYIVVSTTRPETMLGDTAVAVNPQDKRYKKYVGRFVLLPLMERKIPVIEDNFVDMNFGTGAVKVTPAHDTNDFEIGRRHNLEEINIMTDTAIMNKNTDKYNGLDRYEARKKVLEDLEKQGYLAGKKDHISSIGICSRCDTVIEPRISMQWFVSMKTLAEPSIKAVHDGRVKFIPKKWEKIYYNWMENIKDWCISRQLWWGHRIPVWYCKDCNEMIVSSTAPASCKCGSGNLEQESDVLDTWFSSCLWPFASLGWPDKTPELKYYFPTSVLITAHDIIFFWVARMIMMSLYFLKDVPFKEVFINPLVNDVFGQKMSKSKGNVIDPMTIIEKSGSDALRYTLASLTTPGKNLLLGEEKIEGSRNFANKLWNASKFVISNLGNSKILKSPEIIKNLDAARLSFNLWDRWILSKFIKALKSYQKYIEKYNFSFTCRTLTSFFWNDYCDWYIESAKVRIYSKNAFKKVTSESKEEQKNDVIFAKFEKINTQTKTQSEDDILTSLYVLWYVLERYLKLLHPFMPFITEKIWQNIPHSGDSIMIECFPEIKNNILDITDVDTENKIDEICKIIGEIRKVRSELKINPALKINAYIKPAGIDIKKLIEENLSYIIELARLERLSICEPEDKKGFIKSVKNDNEIYIYLLDVIDLGLEAKRISGEIAKVNGEREKSSRKLSNPQFIEKAPKKIIQKEEAKLKQTDKALKILNEQLEKIKSIKR